MTGLMMVIGSNCQENDGFSGHPNDHDPDVDEEDWFNDVSSSHSKVSSMMASIDEDVEKYSLADQDDVGSGKLKSLKKNNLLDMLVPLMLSEAPLSSLNISS
ncbi:hypothetical protein Tco_0848044 [Tanacetum coccineum]